MTKEETQILNLLGEVWNKFNALPVEHICDREEFVTQLHILQRQVMSRPVRRSFID